MAFLHALLARLAGSRFGRRLAPLFVTYEVDEAVARAFRARQLQAVLRLTPLTMAANALNVVLVASAFWQDAGWRAFLLAWGLGIGFIVVRGLRVWLRSRHRPPRQGASAAALRRATGHAAALAGLWALVPLVLFPSADSAQQLLVATVSTGMICAGGFALATLPAAGTAYVVVLGAGAAIGLLRADFAYALTVGALLFVYCLIVVASVWSTARMFGARLMAEAEAARQNEVIGLLLRDFEENASDVLWEIDASGRLCHVSPRLVALFGSSAAELGTHPVAELLERLAPGEEAAAHLAAIRDHIARGLPFRDLPMATSRRGATRWWSLSAKPLVDEQGCRTGWRGVATDITEAQHANRRLSWLAHFDPLTGLANRHQFRGQLAELMTPAQGGALQPCAVLCLDLDHFKTINDTLGHAVGDGLLQEVAQRLLARTRRRDTVARLGGDEFAVILRDVSCADEAEQLTRRLLDGLQTPCDVQGTRIAVRTSVGVALAPRDGSDIDTLLNNADLALYAAKTAGRGEFRFFAPQMAALTRRRLVIEQALRDALAREELSLAFQPIVDLADWRVTGFEALLRWHHPELGEVTPSEFVPVAEDAGLIQAIGAWVLGEACRQAAGWPQALAVSVNVSPVQAMSPDLLRTALAALERSGLAPARLELEITESIFLHETQATRQSLRALHDAGLRIALDDFGTGYSSLAYLRRFPFHTLKIDRSFVGELMTRRDARAIAKTIVDLANTLHMRTVAEGVEDPAQAAVLRRYGCSAMQGFVVAEPLAPQQVLPFLAGWGGQAPPANLDSTPTAMLPLGEAA